MDPLTKPPRLIFAKLPKTAGTSIVSFFEKELKPSLWIDSSAKPWPSKVQIAASKFLVVCDHQTPRFYKKYPDIWNESLTFTVVRNPYYRVLSAWKYCASTRDLPLLDCLKQHLPKKPIWWKRHFKRFMHDYTHFSTTQSEFIFRGSEPVVDRIVKLEQLEPAIMEVASAFGCPLKKLPTKNRNTRQINRYAFSDEEAAAVRALFKDDFRLLDYSEDPNLR